MARWDLGRGALPGRRPTAGWVGAAPLIWLDLYTIQGIGSAGLAEPAWSAPAGTAVHGAPASRRWSVFSGCIWSCESIKLRSYRCGQGRTVGAGLSHRKRPPPRLIAQWTPRSALCISRRQSPQDFPRRRSFRVLYREPRRHHKAGLGLFPNLPCHHCIALGRAANGSGSGLARGRDAGQGSSRPTARAGQAAPSLAARPIAPAGKIG